MKIAILNIALSIIFSLAIISCEDPDNSELEFPDTTSYPHWPNTSSTNQILEGTSWVIWQYRSAKNVIPIQITDTLQFISSDRYLYSNSNPNIYSIYNIPGGLKLNLQSTPWGNISGTIQESAVNFGNINGAKFTDNFNNSINIDLWIRKL